MTDCDLPRCQKRRRTLPNHEGLADGTRRVLPGEIRTREVLVPSEGEPLGPGDSICEQAHAT
jgi:hypothetical protein